MSPRLSARISRLLAHAFRLTPHVSRLTFHAPMYSVMVFTGWPRSFR